MTINSGAVRVYGGTLTLQNGTTVTGAGSLIQSVRRLRTFVILVTNKNESQQLEQQMMSSDWRLHDVVLNEGTWLPDTMVVDDKAFGLLIGGHTVFQFFRDIPDLVGKTVANALPLRRRHGSLLFGWWLRRRWARRVGARLEYPTWRAWI